MLKSCCHLNSPEPLDLPQKTLMLSKTHLCVVHSINIAHPNDLRVFLTGGALSIV